MTHRFEYNIDLPATAPAPAALVPADLRAAAVAGLVAAGALVAEHAALWRFRQAMSGYRRPVAYVVGTATLLAAFWGWAGARRQPGAALALTVIVALGGAGTIGAYLWRAYWDRRDCARYGVPWHMAEEVWGEPAGTIPASTDPQ